MAPVVRLWPCTILHVSNSFWLRVSLSVVWMDEGPPWRQPRGNSMFFSVNYHTNATSKRWHLWEIDIRFAPGLPPGWRGLDGRGTRGWGLVGCDQAGGSRCTLQCRVSVALPPSELGPCPFESEAAGGGVSGEEEWAWPGGLLALIARSSLDPLLPTGRSWGGQMNRARDARFTCYIVLRHPLMSLRYCLLKALWIIHFRVVEEIPLTPAVCMSLQSAIAGTGGATRRGT